MVCERELNFFINKEVMTSQYYAPQRNWASLLAHARTGSELRSLLSGLSLPLIPPVFEGTDLTLAVYYLRQVHHSDVCLNFDTTQAGFYRNLDQLTVAMGQCQSRYILWNLSLMLDIFLFIDRGSLTVEILDLERHMMDLAFLSNLPVFTGYQWETIQLRDDKPDSDLLTLASMHIKLLEPGTKFSQILSESISDPRFIQQYRQMLTQIFPPQVTDNEQVVRELVHALRTENGYPKLYIEKTARDRLTELRSNQRSTELRTLTTQDALLKYLQNPQLPTSKSCSGDYYEPAMLSFLKSMIPYVDIGDELELDLDYETEVIFRGSDVVLETFQTEVRDFVVYNLTLEIYRDGVYLEGHANVVILDKQHRTLEVFDPYGQLFTQRVFDLFEMVASVIGYHFYPSDTFCPVGPQVHAGDNSDCPKDQGYCVVFSTLYLHSRILEPNMDAEELLKRIMNYPPSDLLQMMLRYLYILERILPERSDEEVITLSEN
jgi:hypothetical protein